MKKRNESIIVTWTGLLPVLLALILVSRQCGPHQKQEKELLVFGAMSLKKPFDEMTSLYQRENPGVRVLCNYASSGTLAAQVVSGAPADLFAPASMRDMELVAGKGLVRMEDVKVFAGNRILLVASRPGIRGFKGLASPEVRRIAVGDPRIVPAGRYGMQVLAYYKLEAVLKPKLIYGEHVPQLCDYAARGEVDAALVFYSDYLARKDRLVLLETAPPFSHGEISYPIAVIRTAANPVEARRFMEMVLSGRGRVIMMKYGFKPSEKEVAWKIL